VIEEQATVVRSDEQGVWVELQRQSACGHCAARSGCGTAVLGKVLGKRLSRVRAVNKQSVKAGDRVIIGIRESALVRGSMAVYLVPLLTMIVSALAGRWFFGAKDEPMIILSGLAGLLAGFLWLRRFSCRNIDNENYQPVVLRKLDA
jgi:sigma-E factor negative regulatory protein RseC